MEKKTPKQAIELFEQIIKASVKDKPKPKKVKNASKGK